MPLRPEGTAPYAPPATVLEVIHGFRERGWATPFDAAVLARGGITESVIPRVLKSLEVLDLIDEGGMPTAHLEGLRRATTDDFQARLAEVVKGVYAEVFQFADPAKDGLQRIADAFRAYNPVGQRGRMVTLFIGLCEAAGIIPEGKKPTGSVGRPASTTTPRATKRPKPQGPSVSTGKAQFRNQNNGGTPPAISGLLASLPSEGKGWTEDRRKKWLATFTTVLDFSYPIGAAEESEGDTDDE